MGSPKEAMRRAANSFLALTLIAGAGIIGSLVVPASASAETRSGSTGSAASQTESRTSKLRDGSPRVIAAGAASSTHSVTGQFLSSKAGSSLKVSATGQKSFTLPIGGSGATIHGIPTPTVRPASSQTATTVSLLGSQAQVAVPANGKVPYGELLTVVAKIKVRSGNKSVTSGMVDFSENGTSVRPEFTSSAICQAVPVVKGTATCAITALAASPTPYQFGASYTPAQGSLTSSKVTSAQGVAVTVVRASTTTSLSGAPDPSSPGSVRLQAVVANSSAGSSLAPTGTVSFEQGGVALACLQGQPILTEASSSTSSVSCDVTDPSGSTAYRALYVPTVSSDFAASGPVSVSVASGTLSALAGGSGASSPGTAPPTGSVGLSSLALTAHTACSSVFSTLWSDGASGSTTLKFTPGSSKLTFLANLSLTEAATSGQCDPSTSIAFSAGSLSFLGSALSGTSLGGTIADATGSSEPQLCITSGNLGGEGLTLSGSLCFSISSATSNGGTVDNVSASLSQSSSVSIIPSVLTLSGVSVNISNGTVATPTGCSLTNTTDWYLTVSGSLALTTPSVSATETAAGCIDLTAGTNGTLEITSNLAPNGLTLGSAVTLNSFDVTITYSSSSFGVQGSAGVTINVPTGGSLSLNVTVAFDSSGTLVVGGQADLSNILSSSLGGTASAYVYFATAAYPKFDTGTSVGTIDLVQGLNFALSASLPSSFISTMQQTVHIDFPSTAVAVGSFDTSTDTFKLAITLTFGSGGVQLFDNQNVALDLNSASVALEVSASQLSVNFSLNGTLYPDGTGTGAQAVPVAGTLTAVVSDSPSFSIGVSVNEPTVGACGTGSGWTNAFGDSGLTVECAEVSVGVTDVFPFVSGSINAVITSLPSTWASAIGYQQGAPITLAFGFNPYYLDLSIGTFNSQSVALEPLESVENGKYASVLQVSYAQLCFMQPGATPLNLGGGLTCAPGFVLGFTATIGSGVITPVTVNVLASLTISPPSIDFSVNISQITVGSDLNIGPVTLVVCASTQQTCDNNTSNFQFEFDGSFSLSGSATVPKFLEVSGSLSLSINVNLSSSGFTALVSGSGTGSIAGWNVFANCSGTPISCAGGWFPPTSVSINLGTTGLSANSSGVTLTIDGTDVTFPFSSAPAPPPPPPTTSTSLALSSATSTYGQPVVLTATVSGSGATFDGGGSVSFYLDAANGQFAIPGCSGTNAVSLIDNNGTYTATCTTSTDVVPSSGDTMILPAGSDSIVAQYSGDSNFPVSTSSSVNETVNAATPTLAISASPIPDYFGQSLTLSVNVSPTDGGGTVSFQDGGTSIAGCSGLNLAGDSGLGLGTDNSAQATCSVGSSWPADTHPITVIYTGDASANMVSVTHDVVVNMDNTTTSVSVSPMQATYGNESTSVFTVNVTTTHGESLPATENVTVHVGSASCTAPVAPSSGGGTGTCSIGNIDLGVSSSAYTVTAAYPGDADLNGSGPATAPAGFTVIKDNTMTSVSVSPSSAPYALETGVTFTVNVTTAHGELLPATENVTVHVGSTSCTAFVAPSTGGGTGSCQLAVAVLPVGGPYAVSATYLGDSDLNRSTGMSSFDVVTTYTPDCSNYAGANLTAKDLAGANLAGCNLSGANLMGVNLEGVNLAGANLSGANLMGAILQGDNLVNADLQGANLKGDNIQYANLQGVDLQRANLMYANLDTSYNFTGANLMGANFQHATLVSADLENSNLSDANFHYANLTNANLANANVRGTQFKGATMTGVTT